VRNFRKKGSNWYNNCANNAQKKGFFAEAKNPLLGEGSYLRQFYHCRL